MKKFLIIILAIIIPSSLNAHPLGYGDKKVDYNYNRVCTFIASLCRMLIELRQYFFNF